MDVSRIMLHRFETSAARDIRFVALLFFLFFFLFFADRRTRRGPAVFHPALVTDTPPSPVPGDRSRCVFHARNQREPIPTAIRVPAFLFVSVSMANPLPFCTRRNPRVWRVARQPQSLVLCVALQRDKMIT